MRLGTRASELALAQARLVANHLQACGVAETVELVAITTSGDARDVGSSRIEGTRDTAQPAGDKSRWVDAIEQALIDGDVDLAVHSAKDVPGDDEIAGGLQIGAVLPRGPAADVLVGAPSLADLPQGARVGTSSLRRRSQLLAEREDLEVVELRGNVPTRIEKLERGEADAIVIAEAGLERLGLSGRIGARLDPLVFVPAPGQGTLVIEGRELPTEALHLSSGEALGGERRVVAALGAGCETSVGAYDDGESLVSYAGTADGSSFIRDRVLAPSAAERATIAIDRLLSLGARELIGR